MKLGFFAVSPAAIAVEENDSEMREAAKSTGAGKAVRTSSPHESIC